MGLIDSMKNAVRGTSGWLRGLGGTSLVEDARQDIYRGYLRTTTASRRAERLGRERTVHVSKAITDDVHMAVDWGMPDLAHALLDRAKGVTYYSPARHVKRKADELAAELGLNNKARRHLRKGMVRRLAEMEAQNG